MTVNLNVYQIHKTRPDVLCASGEVEVKDLAWWFITDYTPSYLPSFTGSIVTVSPSRLVLEQSTFSLTIMALPGLVVCEDGNLAYSWRYEFVRSQKSPADFSQFVRVVWTYSRAWRRESPDTFGIGPDRFKELEAQLG